YEEEYFMCARSYARRPPTAWNVLEAFIPLLATPEGIATIIERVGMRLPAHIKGSDIKEYVATNLCRYECMFGREGVDVTKELHERPNPLRGGDSRPKYLHR